MSILLVKNKQNIDSMGNQLANPTGKSAPKKSASDKGEISGQELVNRVGAEARRQKKRLERITLYSVFGVIIVLGILGWVTDGRIFSSPWQALIALEAPGNASRNHALNCRNPKNRNTPYCVERKARTKADWGGIVRNTDGRASQFTLHGK